MTELADIIPPKSDGVTVRRARVLEVKGSSLVVDMGGGITVARLDSCNPLPGQQVYILSEGSSMTAIAAIGGEYRQATVTVTANATNTVTGILNGVSTAITKVGAFTAAVGAVLPLIWSADGSAVWAGATPGAAYVPPPPAAPPASGGGGVTSGTTSYPATRSAAYMDLEWVTGNPVAKAGYGAFFYGASRFRELQGRTITGFRASLSWNDTGSLGVYGHPHASAPPGLATLAYNGGLHTLGGWVSLPVGLANYLIAGSGTGGLTFADPGPLYGSLKGTPYGTLQFDWRK